MNPSVQTWVLARREFVERVTSKPFIISMTLIAVAILAIGPISGALSSGEPEATTIGLVGTQPDGLEEELAAQSQLFDIRIQVDSVSAAADIELLLESGDLDVVLDSGGEVIFYRSVSTRMTGLIQRSLDSVQTRATLEGLGLTDQEVASVEARTPVTVSTVEDLDAQDDASRAAAFFGSVVLFMSILMFGQYVAMGTVEEKQNRVVEIVLSRVRSWQILVGKVAGIGLLGLLQLLVLAGAAYASALLADLADVDVRAFGLPIIVAVLFWFILGYTFYGFLYAAVGSTVSRQEDLQGAVLLPMVLLVPGYLLAIAAVNDPDALMARIGSLMPMWAPFVMPVRVAAGSAQSWEIAVAVIGSIAAAAVLVWVGSRMYRGALLSTGARVKLKDAWQAATD